MSIELSLEDVKKVAYHYGFVMEVRTHTFSFSIVDERVSLLSEVTLTCDSQVENMIETTYTANMRAMMQVTC
jgi:carnosine N-methyltransferase